MVESAATDPKQEERDRDKLNDRLEEFRERRGSIEEMRKNLEAAQQKSFEAEQRLCSACSSGARRFGHQRSGTPENNHDETLAADLTFCEVKRVSSIVKLFLTFWKVTSGKGGFVFNGRRPKSSRKSSSSSKSGSKQDKQQEKQHKEAEAAHKTEKALQQKQQEQQKQQKAAKTKEKTQTTEAAQAETSCTNRSTNSTNKQ